MKDYNKIVGMIQMRIAISTEEDQQRYNIGSSTIIPIMESFPSLGDPYDHLSIMVPKDGRPFVSPGVLLIELLKSIWYND